MQADSTCIRANAPMAPAYTTNLAFLIASTAAMKKVLSPISVTRIITSEWMVAVTKLFVTVVAEAMELENGADAEMVETNSAGIILCGTRTMQAKKMMAA